MNTQEKYYPTHTVKIIRLKDGESIPHPASTKKRIYGPAKVTQKIYPDGGIDTKIKLLDA
jgi:hypothetical protein